MTFFDYFSIGMKAIQVHFQFLKVFPSYAAYSLKRHKKQVSPA